MDITQHVQFNLGVKIYWCLQNRAPITGVWTLRTLVYGHFGPKTLWTQDSSALYLWYRIVLLFCVGAELSLGHFGTSAEVSQHFMKGPKCPTDISALVPNCLRSKVSWVRSVRTPPLLAGLLHAYIRHSSCQHLLSAKWCQLVMPWHRPSKFGGQAYTVTGPMVRTSLLDSLQDPMLSIDNFRSELHSVVRNPMGYLAH